MIGRLTGLLAEKNPPQIVLDLNGVGYEIDVPMSTFYNLPDPGATVTLYTHLVVREDAHLLYGFLTENERRAFRLLTRTVFDFEMQNRAFAEWLHTVPRRLAPRPYIHEPEGDPSMFFPDPPPRRGGFLTLLAGRVRA